MQYYWLTESFPAVLYVVSRSGNVLMKEPIEDWLAELASEKNVRFQRLFSICEEAFGPCRTKGSHHFFKMPWQGRPQINLQKAKGGKAKSYQVKDVRYALERLLLEFAADDNGGEEE